MLAAWLFTCPALPILYHRAVGVWLTFGHVDLPDMVAALAKGYPLCSQAKLVIQLATTTDDGAAKVK